MTPHPVLLPQEKGKRFTDLPDGGGCYTLVLVLPKRRSIRVGGLGKALFPAGIYLYTGSALRSLRGRIGRHLRKGKKRHWHIDYLLNSPDAVKAIALRLSSTHEECSHNKQIARFPGVEVILPRFGSSDCRAGCASHLFHLRSTRPRDASKRLIGLLKDVYSSRTPFQWTY